MISARLQGGLGNQMFQIATAHALALRVGVESGFVLSACHTPLQGNPSTKYIDNVLKNVNNVDVYPTRGYKEANFSYNEPPTIDDLILDGYFQSEKYFKNFETEIKDLFYINPDDLLFIKKELNWDKIKKPITAVHIRRGDYVRLADFHLACDNDYYNRAMKEIGDSTFIFLSDDIEWVKEHFKGDNIMYSPLTSEILDLSLMTICDNVIISNSSFSWWGAWLNKNKNKKIVGPKTWFAEKGPKDQQDVIPDDWIKI